MTRSAPPERFDYLPAVWEQAADALVLSDASGRVLAANPAYYALYGLRPAQVLGHDFAILFPPEQRDWARAEYAGTFHAAEPQPSVEAVVQAADGSERIVDVRYAFLTEAGARVAMLSIVRDITAQKRAESALRASEQRYRELVEQASDSIYTLGLDGSFQDSNPQGEAVLGYTRAELRRLSLASLVLPEDQPQLRMMLTQHPAGAPPTMHELSLLTRAGQRVTLELTTRLVMEQGQPVGVQAIARDISARKQAQAEREAFVASVSHDLNSPLTTLSGMLQLLQRRATSAASVESERLLGALTMMQAAVRTATALVQEFVDLSRLQQGGGLDLDRQPVDLVALLTACVATARQAQSDREIRVQGAPAELHLLLDAGRIERVVHNLLGNATKYSPAEGTIAVSLAREQADGQDWAVLAVCDQGIGIPAAELPHVVERFYRGSNVGRIAGSGIGLAGGKQIVEQHGGMLTLASVEGIGTTVTVRLPITDALQQVKG